MTLPATRLTKFALLAAGIGCLALLTACGASTSGPVHHSTATPVQSNADAPGQPGLSPSLIQPGTGVARGAQGGHGTVHTARNVGGLASSDETPTGPPAGTNPCLLVSSAETQSYAGVRVLGESVAPLGPTCVYKLAPPRREITLSLQTGSLRQLAGPLRKAHRVTIGGRRGYCGVLGRQMLWLSLAGNRVLNVTAPCGVARRIATIAVRRLTA